MRYTPIQALDGYTAQELIEADEGARVEAWLEATLLREFECSDRDIEARAIYLFRGFSALC